MLTVPNEEETKARSSIRLILWPAHTSMREARHEVQRPSPFRIRKGAVAVFNNKILRLPALPRWKRGVVEESARYSRRGSWVDSVLLEVT